jgi:hypothetical protein
MAGNDEKAEQTVDNLERGRTLELLDDIVHKSSELFQLKNILADVCKEIPHSTELRGGGHSRSVKAA